MDHREIGRDDWIRTSDPLTPSQVRYQAALHPEIVACCQRRDISRPLQSNGLLDRSTGPLGRQLIDGPPTVSYAWARRRFPGGVAFFDAA